MTPEIVKYIMDRACLRKANLNEEAANRIVDQAAAEGRTLYYYKCDFCGSFHITKELKSYKSKIEML